MLQISTAAAGERHTHTKRERQRETERDRERQKGTERDREERDQNMVLNLLRYHHREK